jgi:hypothetical protein
VRLLKVSSNRVFVWVACVDLPRERERERERLPVMAFNQSSDVKWSARVGLFHGMHNVLWAFEKRGPMDSLNWSSD